ncbi:MAG TPA: 7TM diverse intracellular signaling domain-containing protein [Chitinophagaceae bacterium]|nr:7TM diverse intracellular signaling domain-containing protein [Chitinophagaceae bacterium]
MKFILFIALLSLPMLAFATGDTTYITNENTVLLKNNEIQVFSDVSKTLPFNKIRSLTAFHAPNNTIPNLSVSPAVIWLKFTLFNNTNEQQLLINLKKSNLNYVTLYYPVDNNGNYTFFKGGNLIPISQHKFKDQNNLFEVPIPPYTSRTMYIRIKSIGQIVAPLYVGTIDNIMESINRDRLVFGIYLGIILIMFFYNFFIYFSVRDESYLYYIGYIFFIGFAQFCLEGYGYRFLWNNSPLITLQSINWVGALSGIGAAVFLRVFLHTKEKLPIFDKVLIGFILLYILTILLTLFGLYDLSYILIDVIAFTGSFAFLGVGIKFAAEGFRPAKFFLIAWSFFIASIILYVIKDFGLISYNFITSNILLIGSSIEIALLSFALADRINVLKREKEISQAKALQVSREKEQFVQEQNIILESKINERTFKLQQINKELKRTLKDLKETQSQLVDAEKMASLGQLTAGIAHEINNPINFVKSNIKPLQLDIHDVLELVRKYDELNTENIQNKLKDIHSFREEIEFEYIVHEIETLLSGINDGANRTAEIVKGLRTFSRVDESELKEADIHEGIDTTLMLLANSVPQNLTIVKDYASLPRVDCFPGKLNQVFMNVLVNAIQAIKSKGTTEEDEERIIITTEKQHGNVVLRIADTGPGIPAAVKGKIFDPFFTTKDVGEGTGLGLSIAYSIIEKHHGKIEAFPREGGGTEFVITLPLKQRASKQDAPADMETSPKS